MVGVGRALCGSPSPTPLPKQGHPEQAAQVPSSSTKTQSPDIRINIAIESNRFYNSQPTEIRKNP